MMLTAINQNKIKFLILLILTSTALDHGLKPEKSYLSYLEKYYGYLIRPR
jgi:hypothetical protein